MNATLNPEVTETKPKFEPMDNMENVDEGAFYVWQARWGTWCSCDNEGKGLITSLHREQTISATRFYLKGLQEGWGEPTKSYEGTVGGKL